MTAQLNQEIRHVFEVVNPDTGATVTGLVTEDFTLTLKRESSGSLASATETVAVTEISDGLYWVTYTPTADLGVYYLTVDHASYICTPAQFQDDVESGFAASGGPYLTTRTNVKTALGITGTKFDSAIDALLAQVTDLVQTYCRRTFAQATYTEYYKAFGEGSTVLVLRQYPVDSVTSVHVSTELPRSYGSDELLTADEDYFLEDADAGLLERVDGGVWPAKAKATKVVYVAGYSTIPGDLERAAIEIICMKMYKAGAGGGNLLYPFQGISQGEGAVTGVRLNDIPPQTREVLDAYRDKRVA